MNEKRKSFGETFLSREQRSARENNSLDLVQAEASKELFYFSANKHQYLFNIPLI